MSQSTTKKSVSSPRASPERPRASDATVIKPTKLISLSKLKDLMHKSESDNRRRDSRYLTQFCGLNPRLTILPSIIHGNLSDTNLHQNQTGPDCYVPNSKEHINDEYSARKRSSEQSRNELIEGESGEKLDDCANNSNDHHQSAEAAAPLNQFGIGVSQQESEQPQSKTATRRYYANNVSANTGTAKEVEPRADLSSSQQASLNNQQEQLYQAVREGRKRRRVCSSQSGASNESYRRETLSEKGIGPCRIDTCGRNNMTPSSDALCQSFESFERRDSTHLRHSLGGYNRGDLTDSNFGTPQSDKTRVDSDKLSKLPTVVDSTKLAEPGCSEHHSEKRSRPVVLGANDTDQAVVRQSASLASVPSSAAAITATTNTSPAAASSSSSPTGCASHNSNTSVSQDRETNLIVAYEPTLKQNFARQPNAHSCQQSRATNSEDSEVEAEGGNQRTVQTASFPNQIDRRHLASYIVSKANNYRTDNSTDTAGQHHCRMISHNMNTLNNTRLPNYVIDRSNIRVSVSTTIENIAACDISHQQHAAVAPPSNERSTDHNYNNYSLVTSSKSTSPNSISLTPSPKTQPMEALAADHHGSNQIIPPGPNLSAHNSMPVVDAHRNQLNHHYITTMNTVAAQQPHQINQQQYSQYSQPPASSGIQMIVGHDQTTYDHLQQQQQQQQQQQEQHHHHQHHHQQPHHHHHQQQQPQHPHQHPQPHPHQYQHHQQQHQEHQQQAQSISNQQFIYHQIASGAAPNPNHGYANVCNSAQYHNQLQSSNNQASSLMAEAHQNHLNTAAAAAHAAAAVVSRTLKTVAHQHNHQHQHYNNNGFNASSGLMNMAVQHPQFHSVNSHHIGHNHMVMGIQQSQQQQPHHHQQTNHSIVTRKYSCRMCPQVFMSKAEMKYHTQNHLREAKPYKCLQCPKAFANSSYLSQHMRIHQGLKPYACDICSRKFTQLSHLQQHKRTHTGDKPYKCTYMNCTKQFSQLSNLQSHSRVHQLDKPYKCNSCYKCFHDEQSLLEHIPRHLESKHLKTNLCIFCGSSYQQERGLVKHFQQYHTDKAPTLVTAAIAAGTTGNTSLIASLVSSTKSVTNHEQHF